jgi:hypothetical protein
MHININKNDLKYHEWKKKIDWIIKMNFKYYHKKDDMEMHHHHIS